MRKVHTGFVLMGLLAVMAFGSAASAQEIESMPARFQGLFVSGECDVISTENLWVLTEHFELLVDKSVVILGPLLVQKSAPDWIQIQASNEQSFEYFLTRDTSSGRLVYAVPRLETGAVDPSGLFSDQFERTEYNQCDEMPLSIRAVYGETVAVMRALDRAVPHCAKRDIAACVDELFGAFDRHKDGALSRAELARAARFLLQLVAAQDSERNNVKSVLTTSAGALLAAPALAQVLLLNNDYDGSGSLTADELLEERIGFGVGLPELEWHENLRALGRAAIVAVEDLPIPPGLR